MSYSKDTSTRLLRDIISELPKRVKLTKEVLNLPFVLGDVLTLVLVKTLQIVHAEDRLTGEIVKIPLDFKGKFLARLGKRCSSVDEIKVARSTLLSVEEQFEVPIGPWNKMTIKSGSILAMTSIDCDRDLVVKVCQTEDLVRIKEDTPLHTMTVVDEILSLKDVINNSRLPVNVVVREQEVSNKYFKSGNYKLEQIINEEFVMGFHEKDRKNVLIPACCNMWVNEEVPFPDMSTSCGNASFMQRDMDSNITFNNLYFEYINYSTKK